MVKRILTCLCGRIIEVTAGYFGEPKPFPQSVMLCECKTAYVPTSLGCMMYMGADAEPEVLTSKKYQEWKAEKLRIANKLNIPESEAIIEEAAKVLSAA